MKKWTCAALLAAAMLSPRATQPSAAPPPGPQDALQGRLTITGSNTMAPLVSDIARRFRVLHPGVRIEVQAGGTARGLHDAREGRADIGMVSRALGKGEHDLLGLPIARDGVAAVVHRDNPVRRLSDAQLADIFTGRLANWSAVGGRDAPIRAYRPEGWRASTELFAGHLGVAREALRAEPAPGDAAARLALLADTPDAVLFMSVSIAERAIASGLPIRLLPAAGIPATSRTIRNGSFPMSRALTLTTGASPSPLAKAFIEYCGSSQITDIVAAHDFVPYLD